MPVSIFKFMKELLAFKVPKIVYLVPKLVFKVPIKWSLKCLKWHITFMKWTPGLNPTKNFSHKILNFIEKFLPSPGFEPRTSTVLN